MKNKKLLYILIPATLLLWGAIIYKIVGSFHNSNDVVYNNNTLSPIATKPIIEDTFSINPNYRDPFFGKISRATTNQTPRPITPSQPTVTKSMPTQMIWPTIAYSGLIKNQNSNKQLVMVSINGQSQTLKIGDKIGELELTKAYKDSIEFKLGKEKRFFKK